MVGMTVLQSYKAAWQRRALNIPLLIGIRVLSVALIAPIVVLVVQAGVALSGQAALTDQDIAHFILSPIGFPIFILIAAIWLIGSVVGVAFMTVSLLRDDWTMQSALAAASGLVLARFSLVLRFSISLILRLLVIVLPAAAVGAVMASVLIGDFDINYYLTVRPPEFFLAVGLGGIIAAGVAWVLVPSLLSWAVALHCVMFDRTAPSAAFAKSSAQMDGQRLPLLKDLLIWLALRSVVSSALAVIAGFLITTLPDLMGGGLRFRLFVALVCAGFWALGGLIVSAISLSALSQLLLARYGDASHTELAQAQPTAPSRLLALGSSALLAVVVFGSVSSTLLAPRLETKDDALIIAHRGAAGAFPENTLASIGGAVDAGADWVEIDVQETADGEVVVFHDSDFMKLSGDPTKIWDVTSADLDRLDIGSWFDPRFADERVPSLTDALSAVRDRATLLIELKYYGHDKDLEAQVIAAVEQAGMSDQIAIMSLKYPAVEKMRSLRPGWQTGALAATAAGDIAALDVDFVAVNAVTANTRLVRRLREQNKKLFVWTVNNPLDMSAMLSLGVDGLITDEPELAREVIAARRDLNGLERLYLVLLEHLGLTDQTRGNLESGA